MKNNKLKSEKGVTLIELSVYILVILAVVGIMSSISTFFYGNINIIRDTAKYAAEFDKFNAFILADVNNNNRVSVDLASKTIVFEDGTTYKYNQNDKSLYRGNVKISTNVKAFEISKKTITVNSVDKDILTIKIIIGNSTKNLISKRIDYTLKYW